MPTLDQISTFIALTIAKPTGLAELGVPVVDTTVVKKGRLHEFAQNRNDGKIGRRFQDIRVTAIKTVEGGVEPATIFVQFELFSDDNVPVKPAGGFDAGLYAESENLMTLSSGGMFLPYANFWYLNRYAFVVPPALFDRADRFEFIAKSEEVRTL